MSEATGDNGEGQRSSSLTPNTLKSRIGLLDGPVLVLGRHVWHTRVALKGGGAKMACFRHMKPSVRRIRIILDCE